MSRDTNWGQSPDTGAGAWREVTIEDVQKMLLALCEVGDVSVGEGMLTALKSIGAVIRSEPERTKPAQDGAADVSTPRPGECPDALVLARDGETGEPMMAMVRTAANPDAGAIDS